ncbi:MAG TPA: transglutaminase domain-containing protein [Usitatibacter sp.]|nr:transglutaminase domain-containing protein [Usitatibacter sp.]
MDRRHFFRVAGTASAGIVLPGLGGNASAQGASPAPGPAGAWKTYEVTTRVEVLKPVGVTRIWLPTPLSTDTPYQRSMGNIWSSESGTVSFGTDPLYHAGMVWAEFEEGERAVLTLVSRFATRDIAVDLSRPGNPRPESAATLRKYVAPTELLPTDGIVKETSSAIVKGVSGDLHKARAIYDWVVDNTFRDPKTRGCGTGDIKFMLENNVLGGKCADLNALYVALARAEGIPARDVYGVRVAGSKLGYKSLGKTGGDITGAQHCRAEVYLADYGWVPVDPADVRKVILEEDGGKKKDDPMVTAARERLFGSWEMNWLGYNYAHDLALPGSSKGRIGFLMYPQAETAQGRLDSLDPGNFRYTITAKEIA